MNETISYKTYNENEQENQTERNSLLHVYSIEVVNQSMQHIRK